MSAGLGGRNLSAARNQQQQLANRQPTAALNELFPSPTNGRKKLRNIQSLATTISSDGLSTALTVIPAEHYIKHHPDHAEAVKASGRPLVVLGGHRRLAAAQAAGLARVPVNIVYEVKSVRIASLLENLQREPLTPVEEGEEFQRAMQEEGLSQRALATRLGADTNKRVSQTYISQRIALLKLIPELQDDVDDQWSGERDTGITLKFAAEVLARLSKDEQRAYHHGDLTKEAATAKAKGEELPKPVIAPQSPPAVPADQPPSAPPTNTPQTASAASVIAPQSPPAAPAFVAPVQSGSTAEAPAADQPDSAEMPMPRLPADEPSDDQHPIEPTPSQGSTPRADTAEHRVLTLQGSPHDVAVAVIGVLSREELQTFYDLLMASRQS
ncbi:hypothetical protein ABTX81_30315 [Kitasatospora sp. NPDC097605]|uniref:ParB/RepB/Spo0J family partition protein n=1 Tax=Kitasatospora sp. NPDC097605 TaxID=3157226 RepID=UPI00331B5521